MTSVSCDLSRHLNHRWKLLPYDDVYLPDINILDFENISLQWTTIKEIIHGTHENRHKYIMNHILYMSQHKLSFAEKDFKVIRKMRHVEDSIHCLAKILKKSYQLRTGKTHRLFLVANQNQALRAPTPTSMQSTLNWQRFSNVSGRDSSQTWSFQLAMAKDETWLYSECKEYAAKCSRIPRPPPLILPGNGTKVHHTVPDIGLTISQKRNYLG